jgi:protein TonB
LKRAKAEDDMRAPADNLRARLTGLGGGALGSLLVVLSILFMNKQVARTDADAALSGSSIRVERKEKPPAAKPVSRPKPKSQRTRTAAAPTVGIDSGLAGLDFGLPQFDQDDLGALTGDLLGANDDTTMTDDTVDTPPRILAQSPMQYPVRAKAGGVTGYVVLSVLIGPTGAVERVKVIESQPAGVFDDTATAGVRTWKFEPASYKGEAVRVWATQRVRFDLG